VQSRERDPRAAVGLSPRWRHAHQPGRPEPRRPHPADRLHTAAQARSAFDAVRSAGFDDVSVDLIYGLPGLDLATWEETVTGALGWQPDHLSAYALTLDEGSLWHAAGSAGQAAGRRGAGAPPSEASESPIVLPSEDTVTAQYARLAQLAGAAGLEHYEISNYAAPGHRSTHNQIYWRAEEYLGLGPGACGFLGDVRYGNVKAVERYGAMVAGGEAPVGTHETLTPRQRLAERLILGLRLGDGVPAGWLEERVALGPGRLPATLDAWRDSGLLAERDGRVRLTEAGFLLSDTLFIELL